MIKKEDGSLWIINFLKSHLLNLSHRQRACPILGVSEIDLHDDNLPCLDLFPRMFTQYLFSQCHSHIDFLTPFNHGLSFQMEYLIIFISQISSSVHLEFLKSQFLYFN